MVRAESDQIVATSASGNASWIIISIGISSWTCGFEDLGVGGGLAGLRTPKASSAAVAGRVEGRACALAGHHPPVVVGSHLETHRTHGVEVAHTSRVATLAWPFEGGDGDGQVVTVDEAHVVEILLRTQGDLGEGGRRCAAHAVAEKGAAAVAGSAAAPAVGVEGASVTAPDAAGPGGWDVEGVGLVGWELEASTSKDGLACAWLYAWPHWMWAFVV